MVIANRDYWHQEYTRVRAALENRGLQVVVAAGARTAAVPQGMRLKSPVIPDLALTDVDAADYSAIVFVGGWGASSYQYAFEGTYSNIYYRPATAVVAEVNRLINDFAAQDKPVAGISHGVTVLAWARVDGVSPLEARTAVGWAGGGPGFGRNGSTYPDSTVPIHQHLGENGAKVVLSAAVGDPLATTDDVIVDGKIITAENYMAAKAFARTIAAAVAGQ